MGERGHIQPVPRRSVHQAVRFLAGGRERSAMVRTRADALEHLVRVHGAADSRLWWVRCGRRCIAAAMVFDNAGRTGTLYFSSAAAPGVDAAALSDLVRTVSADALDRGLSFVQTLLGPGDGADVSWLPEAGFVLLAELIYMRLELVGRQVAAEPGPATWRNYRQYAQDELAEAIAATYEGSLDCPLLAGVRDVSDVLAAHKTSGRFTPESWWLLERDGQALGCILVNDCPPSLRAEVVYMGVVPSWRGRGWSGAMLRRAAASAHARGRTALTLAVDAGNHYARKVYAAAGFRETQRRLAYARIAGRGPREG